MALSSTSSTCLPVSSLGTPAAAARDGTSAGSATIVKWNVEPSPATLSTHMVPPISSASRLLTARPRPVPPYLRVVDESTWLNSSNRRWTRSAGMPMPVSRTATWSWSRLVAGLCGEHHFADLGELHRVAEQVHQHLAEAGDVAAQAARARAGSMRKASSSPLRAAGSVTRSKADSMHARRSNGCVSSSSRPASILEKSRMSLMMPSSDSPLERMIVGELALAR